MFSHMSPRTPQSGRKVKARPTYYEDIYGVRNADEAFDRSADVCESEPETDDEKTKRTSTCAKSTGFFKPYTLESDLRVSSDSEEEETAPLDEAGAVKGLGIYRNLHLPYHDDKNTARNRTKSASKPNLFRKKRAPSKPSPRKLTPKKKFGMFGDAPPTPDTDHSTAMESINTFDTVNAGDSGEREGNETNNTNGGLPAAGDLDGSLAVADPGTGEGVYAASAFFREMANQPMQPADDAPTGPQVHYPGFEPSDFIKETENDVPDGEAANETTFTASAAQMTESGVSDAQSAREKGISARSSSMPGAFPEETEVAVEQPSVEEDEEEVEGEEDDTQDQIQVAQPKRRGRPPKSATSSKQPANSKATPRSTRSAALLEAEQGAKIAGRVRKRRSLLTPPPKPSPRKKATARTATLRQKAKRADLALIANAAPVKRQWVVSREKRMASSRKSMPQEVRNWKGEKLDVKGKGYVKVVAGSEDLEEYVKYD
ncbi:hypothetical protein LTR57_013608 [Friedmanniomyces endolithicus]|nr:hypothetical protein LTR57_013608 [Friedmanniomyces endolithicus]